MLPRVNGLYERESVPDRLGASWLAVVAASPAAPFRTFWTSLSASRSTARRSLRRSASPRASTAKSLAIPAFLQAVEQRVDDLRVRGPALTRALELTDQFTADETPRDAVNGGR